MTDPLTPYDRILALIAERGLGKTGACLAAGLARNVLAQAAHTKVLSVETIEKFAAFLGVQAGQLLGDTPADTAPTDPSFRRIPILRIEPSPFNPRKTFDATTIAELADSIAAQGLLQNLVVRPKPGADGFYVVVAGERRYRALALLVDQRRMPDDLRDHGIPCRVVAADDGDHVALAILENLQREDVNPLEEADALAKLHALDPVRWSTAALAQRIGKSQRHIQLRLALATGLTEPAREQLRTGKINLAQARVIATVPAEDQIAALDQARYYQAEQLRRELQRKWVPVEHALPGMDLGSLPQAEDAETGKIFVTDPQAFATAQAPAIDALELELRRDFATVIRDRYFYDGRYVPDPRACVIEIGGDGAVTVHRGIGPRPKAAQDDENQRIWDIRRAVNAELEAARDALLAELRGRLDLADAVNLVLWEALGDPGHALGTLSLRLTLIAGGPLEALTEPCRWEETEARCRDGADAACWQALTGLDYPARMSLLIDMVAGALTDLSAPVLELAQRRGVAVPPELLWTDEEYEAEIARRLAALPVQTDFETAIAEVA